VELKNRVEQISALIEDLRQAVGDGRTSRALIDSLFRSVHSFKAAASAEGRHDASTAAHQFESLLHALRTGELPLDNDVLHACEQSAAGLLEGCGIGSFDHFTITEIYKVERQPLLPADFGFLRDEERHRAEAAIQEGANLYVMEAVFEISEFDERFRRLKERLAEVGELISTSPIMKDDKIIFQVVYASQTEKIHLQTVLRQTALAGKSLASSLNKQVEFVLRGEESVLDRHWEDVLSDLLLHLVRNALDHGIESNGTVVLETSTTPNATAITVTDDGRGIAPEILPLVFQPGFTTATEVTQFSGRGVGLDAVKTIVESLGGSVSVTSEPAKGSSFKIILPNQ
jgi:chemotaxis protein histidine kinase CheA